MDGVQRQLRRRYAPFPPPLSSESACFAARAVRGAAADPRSSLAISTSHSSLLLQALLSVWRLPAAAVVLTGPVIDRRVMDVFGRYSLVAEPILHTLQQVLGPSTAAAAAAASVRKGKLLYLRRDALVAFSHAEVRDAVAKWRLEHLNNGLFVFEVDASMLSSTSTGASDDERSTIWELAGTADVVVVRLARGAFRSTVSVFRDAILYLRVRENLVAEGGRSSRVYRALDCSKWLLSLSLSDPLAFGFISNHLPRVARAAEKGSLATIELRQPVPNMHGVGSNARDIVVREFVEVLRQCAGSTMAVVPWGHPSDDSLLPCGTLLVVLRQGDGERAVAPLLQLLQSNGFHSQSVKSFLQLGDPLQTPCFVDRALGAAIAENGLFVPLHEGMGGRARIGLLSLLLQSQGVDRGAQAVHAAITRGHLFWQTDDAPCLWAYALGGPFLGLISSRL